jgi:hypothetical protein
MAPVRGERKRQQVRVDPSAQVCSDALCGPLEEQARAELAETLQQGKSDQQARNRPQELVPAPGDEPLQAG